MQYTNRLEDYRHLRLPIMTSVQGKLQIELLDIESTPIESLIHKPAHSLSLFVTVQ